MPLKVFQPYISLIYKMTVCFCINLWEFTIEWGVPLSLFRIRHCPEDVMRMAFNFVLNALLWIVFSHWFRSSRVCTEDCVVDGLSMKKGMYLLFPAQTLHNNPELWSEPDKFDPER